MWECTECDVENDMDPDAEEGQLITCTECGSEYEVISLDPLELELADTAVSVEADPDGEDDAWEEDDD